MISRKEILEKISKKESVTIEAKGTIISKTIVEILPVNKYKLMTGRYRKKYSYKIVLYDSNFGFIYFGSCNVLLRDCDVGNTIECSLKVLEFGCESSRVYSNGIIFCSLVKDYVSVVTSMVGSVTVDSMDRCSGHEVKVRVPSLERVAVG